MAWESQRRGTANVAEDLLSLWDKKEHLLLRKNNDKQDDNVVYDNTWNYFLISVTGISLSIPSSVPFVCFIGLSPQTCRHNTGHRAPFFFFTTRQNATGGSQHKSTQSVRFNIFVCVQCVYQWHFKITAKIPLCRQLPLEWVRSTQLATV